MFSVSHVRAPFAQLVHIPHFSASTFFSQSCRPSQDSFTRGKEKLSFRTFERKAALYCFLTEANWYLQIHGYAGKFLQMPGIFSPHVQLSQPDTEQCSRQPPRGRIGSTGRLYPNPCGSGSRETLL